MKSSEEGNSTEEEEERYQVFKVQLTQVRQYLIVALLLILAFGNDHYSNLIICK